GVDIRCNAEVANILLKDGAAAGVTLANGDQFFAPVIASNLDAHLTFERLLDPSRLPSEFAAAVQRINYDSASLKINVALSELPDFLACPGTAPGPHHRGTIHICPDQDYIERAYDDAKYGKPSTQPVLECTIPSVVDPTVAPSGKHLMSMFIQYAPYKLRRATGRRRHGRRRSKCGAGNSAAQVTRQRSQRSNTLSKLEKSSVHTPTLCLRSAGTQRLSCKRVPKSAGFRPRMTQSDVYFPT